MSVRANTALPLPGASQRQSNVVSGTISASAIWGGDRRMEGEAYLMGGYGIRLMLESLPGVMKIAAMARVWQPGRLKGITVNAESGVPFLTTNQMFDIRPMVRKWLAPEHVDDLEHRYLSPGTILITCSGNGVANNVGKVFASYSAHERTVVSHDLLRLDTHNSSDFGWIYLFLRSHFGRAMLRSNQYGSSIKHLEPEHVDAIPVPPVSRDVRKELQKRVMRVFSLRDEAYALTLMAEAKFTEAIGQPRSAASAVGYAIAASRMFSSGRRLDGHYFNPIAEAAAQTIEKSGRPTEPLGSIARVFGVPRFKHLYSDSGTPYLDSEDVLKINPDVTKFIQDVSERDSRLYFVERSWVLLVCSGQLYGINGSAVLSTPRLENKLLSNHVIRIVPGPSIRRGYLQMAIGHASLGRPRVLRSAFGTSVPEIAPDDLRDYAVVRLGTKSENEIADAVERAAELRVEADDAEDHAVSLSEAFVDAILRGDPVDEQYDAAVATVRLEGIGARPESVVSGRALETELDELLS